MSEHVLETLTPAELPVVAERLLTDDSIHMVVVRDLVTDEFNDAMLRADSEAKKLVVMNERIPGFSLLQDIVKNWWAVNGYRGHDLEAPVNFTNPPTNQNYRSHIDRAQQVRKEEGFKIFGGLTLSICGGPESAFANWAVKKPIESIKDPVSGSLSEEAFRRRWFRARYNVLYPARVQQFPRDGILVTQHPIPAAHRVSSYNDRKARVIDFPIHTEFPSLQSQAIYRWLYDYGRQAA